VCCALRLSKGQLRQMLATKAVQMSMIGPTVGVVLGIGFGWAVMRAFIAGTGGVGAITVPVGQILVYFGLAAAAGVAASVVPARQATRNSLVQAITSA
jgi:putative ABC transport system permease protein